MELVFNVVEMIVVYAIFALFFCAICILAWISFVAPVQRTFVSYLFLYKNKQHRHKSLYSLSEFKIFLLVVKDEFKNWDCGNEYSSGPEYGYSTNKWFIKKFWKN